MLDHRDDTVKSLVVICQRQIANVRVSVLRVVGEN